MKASITFLLVMLMVPSLAAAGNEPWTLSANNWQQAEELLPAPVLERIKHGDYTFKIVPVDPAKFRANYSRRFWEASAANEGKYDLAPQLCGLADKTTGKMPAFFFGLPFPQIDPADPRAGCKIAWNFTAATSRDTVRTRCITGKPARMLRNKFSEAWDGPESPGTLPMPLQYLATAEPQQRVRRAVEAGNSAATELLVTPVGQIVGRMNQLRPARQVVAEMVNEYLDALTATGAADGGVREDGVAP